AACRPCLQASCRPGWRNTPRNMTARNIRQADRRWSCRSLQEGAKLVHVAPARQLEGIMVEPDVALAVLLPPAMCVGRGDPEQRLAVAPAGHLRIFVFQLEAEKAEQLAVERLRAHQIADAENEMIDADDTGHGGAPSRTGARPASFVGTERKCKG